MHWIKAEMHEYILKNWRLVKVATTKTQRKLFFNLRSNKEGLDAMTPSQIDNLAEKLDVKREDVIEMEMRLSGRDSVALDGSNDDEDEKFAPIAYLENRCRRTNQHHRSATIRSFAKRRFGISFSETDPRSRHIIESLVENDDGSGAGFLHELADEYGVSPQKRIRQIGKRGIEEDETALISSV